MQSESGQTTTEFGLILLLVSIVAIAVLGIVAGSVNELYSDSEALFRAATT